MHGSGLTGRVLLTRAVHDFALKELQKRYDVEVHDGEIPMPAAALRSRIGRFDGLICFPYDRIDAETLDMAVNLKVISTFSVGFDHIDVEHARRRGIRIGYTPDVLTDATADLAFGLMLDVTRRITEGDRIIRSGRWRTMYRADEYLGTGLCGSTLGILGMGRIGQALARRARAFGMNITYHNRGRVDRSIERGMDAEYVPLPRLISESDIISVHVPHTDQTDGMFGMDAFRSMKDTAFLVNTSRGKVVRERDLAEALRGNIIAGAALDVFEDEPVADSPLIGLDNVVLAPHIGSSTVATRRRMAEIVIRNLDQGMLGRTPEHSV